MLMGAVTTSTKYTYNLSHLQYYSNTYSVFFVFDDTALTDFNFLLKLTQKCLEDVVPEGKVSIRK